MTVPYCASSPPIGFYVYRLVDPRNGLPFYVGKGQNSRAWQHEKCFRAGKPSGSERKNAKIADIISAGLSVDVEIVGVFDDEVDALDLEFLLVEESPTLTNVMVGGAGTGRLDSPLRAERRRRVYAEKRARLLRERDRRLEAAAKSRFTERCKSLYSARGADLHQAEIDAWLETLPSVAVSSDEAAQPKKAKRNGGKARKRPRRYRPHNSSGYPRYRAPF